MAWRADAYNPLYFLSPAFDGHRRSTPARHWRIRTGVMQGDTAHTTEINIALALHGTGLRGRLLHGPGRRPANCRRHR